MVYCKLASSNNILVYCPKTLSANTQEEIEFYIGKTECNKSNCFTLNGEVHIKDWFLLTFSDDSKW